jgi:hypothetical protein
MENAVHDGTFHAIAASPAFELLPDPLKFCTTESVAEGALIFQEAFLSFLSSPDSRHSFLLKNANPKV